MRILISNDDGIYSPGLSSLAQAARAFGEVRIVAPDVEQSSMGHAITHSRPLTCRSTEIGDFEAWRVNGTPADCVALGTYRWGRVDAVLSGINLGLNVGNSTWHSGTLAAAKQAVLLNRQGIAFSAPVLDNHREFEHLEPFVARVLELVLGDPNLPLVNVNMPPRPRGLRWTRQSVRHYDGAVVPGRHPQGHEHFWFVVRPIEEVDEGTDRWAVDQGYVSMTPLRLDLTDEATLEKAQVIADTRSVEPRSEA
jgi:5'-nucleotidase